MVTVAAVAAAIFLVSRVCLNRVSPQQYGGLQATTTSPTQKQPFYFKHLNCRAGKKQYIYIYYEICQVLESGFEVDQFPVYLIYSLCYYFLLSATITIVNQLFEKKTIWNLQWNCEGEEKPVRRKIRIK